MLMRARPEGFRRRPFSYRIGSEWGLPQGLFSAEGERWSRQRLRVIPVGSDPRRCPGRHLAMRVMKRALTVLLPSFHTDAVRTSDGGSTEARMAFTSTPFRLLMWWRESVALCAKP